MKEGGDMTMRSRGIQDQGAIIGTYTTAQRDLLGPTPDDAGQRIINTTSNTIEKWDGAAWQCEWAPCLL